MYFQQPLADSGLVICELPPIGTRTAKSEHKSQILTALAQHSGSQHTIILITRSPPLLERGPSDETSLAVYRGNSIHRTIHGVR